MSERVKFLIYVLTASLLFSTMEVAVKLYGQGFDVLQLTYLRYAFATIALIPSTVKYMREAHTRPSIKDMAYLWMIGTLLVCVSMTCLQAATVYANANLVAVLVSSSPVFMMIFAHFFGGEPFTKTKALVLLISVTGLVTVANPFNLAEGNTFLGIALCFGEAVSFGLYTVLAKKSIRTVGELPQLFFSFLLGSLSLLIVLLVMGKPVLEGLSLSTLPFVAYIGVFVTAVAYLLYFKAVRIAGTGKSTVTFFMKPVLGPLIAFMVLREPITLNFVIGVALIVTGSVINLRQSTGK